MENELLWQAFAETGDPICYMLYKAAQKHKASQARAGHRS